MATAYTRADGVGLYLTGVDLSSTAGTVAGALGGARTPIEVAQVEAIITGVMPTIVVEEIGGYPGVGTGQIRAASVDTLAYTPAGGAEGTAVTLTDGVSALLEGATGSDYVRVCRDGDDDLGDAFDLDLRKVYGGLVGGRDITTAESTAGVNVYSAGIIHNHGEAVQSATIYLGTLGTQRVTATAQLPGAGAGTITTATANGFADWPAAGWARITTNAPALREIVYYTSRTSTSLTVPAAGRGRLGTAAAAGAATDTVDAVPGIRIAVEAPGADGDIQTIANDSTSPTGRTWSTAITSAAGLTTGNLAPLGNYGLWIHREIPAGAKASYNQESKIIILVNAFQQVYYGLYRIAEAGVALYSVWRGTDAMPDLTAAATGTSATLPFNVATVPPGAGVRTYYLIARYTDAYGLTSYNTFPHTVTINAAGTQLNATITPPQNVSLTEIGSGYVNLRATYPRGIDATNADYFRYYVTTDGTDPVAGVTPRVSVEMRIGQGLSDSRVLDVTLGPYNYATDLRVLVCSYRVSDTTESVNTTPVTDTITLTAPPVPSRASVSLEGASNLDTGAAFAWITTALSGGVVFWKHAPGVAELWANTSVLVFRAICTGLNQVTLHFPSDWSLVEGAVAGAGAVPGFGGS